MNVYRCELTLHDYMFFATTERGTIVETGGFVHNYALTYALGWARSPYHNEVQQPHYARELSQIDNLYVTPGEFVNGRYVLMQYNTLPETFCLARERSTGYPNWGFIKALRPSSHFRFYVLSKNEISFPRFIRLGKFMAKSRIEVQVAVRVQRSSSSCEVEPLLNWEDLVVKPIPRDVIVNALPTRLVRHSVFEQVEHVRARFNDGSEVTLPLAMSYPKGALCSSW